MYVTLCIIYDVIEILNRIIESPDNDMYEWSIVKKYVSKLNYNFIPGSLRVINEYAHPDLADS